MVLSRFASTTFFNLAGVPEISILDPILFSFLKNDVPFLFTSSCALYADDLKLFSAVDSPTGKSCLHSNLETLFLWYAHLLIFKDLE